jgi:hypothetical protein
VTLWEAAIATMASPGRLLDRLLPNTRVSPKLAEVNK